MIKMKYLVEETYELNGNTRVMLVAHSMGNPYTVNFLNSVDQVLALNSLYYILYQTSLYDNKDSCWCPTTPQEIVFSKLFRSYFSSYRLKDQGLYYQLRHYFLRSRENNYKYQR